MLTKTERNTMQLTVQERELAALVLREHADEMDEALRATPARSHDHIGMTARLCQSAMTVEMRDLAHKLEWGV